jgi:hypothetical protein
VILAYLSPPVLRDLFTAPEALPRMTERSIRTFLALETELARVRDAGVAFEREESTLGSGVSPRPCATPPLPSSRNQSVGTPRPASPNTRTMTGLNWRARPAMHSPRASDSRRRDHAQHAPRDRAWLQYPPARPSDSSKTIFAVSVM